MKRKWEHEIAYDQLTGLGPRPEMHVETASRESVSIMFFFWMVEQSLL